MSNDDRVCEHNEKERMCFFCYTKRRERMIAVLQAEVRAWRQADARHDLTRNVMGDGHNDDVLRAMAATDATLAKHNNRL